MLARCPVIVAKSVTQECCTGSLGSPWLVTRPAVKDAGKGGYVAAMAQRCRQTESFLEGCG
jgi:hypothetical protein